MFAIWCRKSSTARSESAFREDEREWLSTNIAAAEKEIEERRAKLSTDGQRDFDLRHKIATSQATLDDLTRQQVALMSREPNTEEIECQPTPMAKTVTGKEVHVLLSDDHVAVVPFDELIELMKTDAQANVWRLKQQAELERTIGPDQRISPALLLRERRHRRPQRCRYVHDWQRVPLLTLLHAARFNASRRACSGSNHGQLGILPACAASPPEGTTITIWTYPGNYERLRELKRAIRQVGFQIAVRPLPKGMPIGALAPRQRFLSE